MPDDASVEVEGALLGWDVPVGMSHRGFLQKRKKFVIVDSPLLKEDISLIGPGVDTTLTTLSSPPYNND